MESFLIENEPTVRLAAFFGILAVMILWEITIPRRALANPRMSRWISNIGVTFLNGAILRFLFPVLAVGMAAVAEERGWGVLNIVALPHWFSIVIAILVLDLAIYLQHVMFHAVPALWRLHMMHHADLDFDVTTGARFHPIEVILSMLIKLGVILVLGPPAVAVLLFEVILNATAMFNHGNVRIPAGIDSVLRLFVVTPDMHRVHHSVMPKETNSNFGFSLPWWDRLLGTYRAQPAAGHAGMAIGVEQHRTLRDVVLLRMLALPARPLARRYAINREENPE